MYILAMILEDLPSYVSLEPSQWVLNMKIISDLMTKKVVMFYLGHFFHLPTLHSWSFVVVVAAVDFEQNPFWLPFFSQGHRHLLIIYTVPLGQACWAPPQLVL